MTTSFHITTAAALIAAEGYAGLAGVFMSKPFNRSTVVATLRKVGAVDLADMVEARLAMHRELTA